ncbi:peptidoglycan DD-metalloendopeptidase family protein [Virgibacillus oceani]
MKRFIPVMLAVVLVITIGAFQTDTVKAESIDSLQQKISELEKERQELENQRGNLNSSRDDIQENIDENLSEQSNVEKEINDINHSLQETTKNIEEKENEITDTNNRLQELADIIEELNDQITVLEERIEKRDELLKDRLRSIQKSGGNMNYIEVILGSQSFGDFISRATAVNTIMDQDKSIMEAQTRDKQELEENKREVEESKQEVEEKKLVLEEQKDELVVLVEQLDEQMAEKESLMAQLQEEYESLEEEMLTLNEEQELIAAQAEAVERSKQLAESEKGNLEQKAKEETEQQVQATSTGGSGNTPNVGSGGGDAIFIWPASGTFTSDFGNRTHPVYGTQRLHGGVDIAAPIGTPVKAAASGVVSSAGTMGGFGNAILITHTIGGQTYTTLYAHLNSISVSAGQTVSQGQNIGEMGNTGVSTGPHLHFEVHPGGYKNPQNPLQYLP